jgi:hypothetical protein
MFSRSDSAPPRFKTSGADRCGSQCRRAGHGSLFNYLGGEIRKDAVRGLAREGELQSLEDAIQPTHMLHGSKRDTDGSKRSRPCRATGTKEFPMLSEALCPGTVRSHASCFSLTSAPH